MANREHVRQLKKGAQSWNKWYRASGDVRPDLSGVELEGVDLEGVFLGSADLTGAKLRNINLHEAYLSNAVLVGADLRESNLGESDLDFANLAGANLSKVILTEAQLRYTILTDVNLSNADLIRVVFRRNEFGAANLRHALLGDTVFADVDLSKVLGLETCRHDGPSVVDHRTIERSGVLPLSFLRGVGMPDNLIEYLPSSLTKPIQHYSCFISYSARDQEFVDRLYADLQNGGVRCWFAPHDMRIGAKQIDEIDIAIRLRDKLLLILSKHSIASDWVEFEVTKALAEERERERTVLFPIRIDDAVMRTKEAWARMLRDQRNIGDFRRWKEHDEYQKSFERVLRDLTVKKDG